MEHSGFEPFTTADIANPPGPIDLSRATRREDLNAPIDVVTGAARGGMLAVTLAFAPIWRLEDCYGWDLLGRITMRHESANHSRVNVVARHCATGTLGRFYVSKPKLPESDSGYYEDMPPEDLAMESWLRDEKRRSELDFYAMTFPLWDLVRQLPEITEVFIGTAKDLED